MAARGAAKSLKGPPPKGPPTKGPRKEPADPLGSIGFKTWILKVPIHCPACAKKVKKVLQGTEGVYKTEVNPALQKVIVTGNVTVEALIRQLRRHGKHGELWPDDTVKKEKTTTLKTEKPRKPGENNNGKYLEIEEEDFDDFHLFDDSGSGEDSDAYDIKPMKNNKNDGNAGVGGGRGGGMVHLQPRVGGPRAPMNNYPLPPPQPQPQPPPRPQPQPQYQLPPYHRFGPPTYYRPPPTLTSYGMGYSTAYPRTMDTAYTCNPYNQFDHDPIEEEYMARCSIL